MITMQSWMFLGNYERMREGLLKEHSIATMAHLDTRAFDAIRTKMDADHRDVMNSIQKLNDRVAPVAEACAANSQAIRILLKEPK